jgi:ATP-dependent DNA helicase RecQ
MAILERSREPFLLSGPSTVVDILRPILKQYWGFDDFRPLQAEAMECVVSGRDSLVVLPTGGGKSICFQAPAIHLKGMAVVVSPLISLMNDQVDTLVDCGVPAAAVNSSTSPVEKQRIAAEARSGRLKLLYLSPERLMVDRTLEFLQGIDVSFFAIDEAHCISDWGHDFRPEYRMLRKLKELFPDSAIHAYTATATEKVRDDIVRELGLVDAKVLVGSFDRPNLIYRVQRRGDLVGQIETVLKRHDGESVVIYAIRRKDVDELTEALKASGHKAVAYHAGMDDTKRNKSQSAFLNDRAKIIVATIAFGMGIDKSNVRCVIHAGVPKAVENYQQESGRAGRDGLEAECWLFWSSQDFMLWRTIQKDLTGQAAAVASTVLQGMENFVGRMSCRHKSLVEYFGQPFEAEHCSACDVCLDELDKVDNALVLGQKIVSCVVRVGQRFGGDYVSQVLIGSREQRIIDNGHDQVSTWGLLKTHEKRAVRDWVEQLVSQGFLEKTGDYATLQLTDHGRALLKGEIEPKLFQPTETSKRKTTKKAKAETTSWEGVDRELFDVLKRLRTRLSEENGLKPYMVFSDASLRDMARRLPATRAKLLGCYGVGEHKADEYGEAVLAAIAEYVEANDIDRSASETGGDESDKGDGDSPARRSRSSGKALATARKSTPAARAVAFALFDQGQSVDEVAETIARARSTVVEYFVDYLQSNAITDATPYVRASELSRIEAVASEIGFDALRPIHDALGGDIGYDTIRIAVTCLRNAAGE